MTDGHAWPGRVAILGAGTMGASFAQIFSLAGIPCTIADRTPGIGEQALERLVRHAERCETRGLFPAGAAERIASLVDAAPRPEDGVEGAEFVLEAVAEDPAVKHDLYRRIEPIAGPDAVIASNTSAIPISQLATALERPDRFLGTHWFNPPQWVPGVEVIPTEHTRRDVVDRIIELHARLGKRPVEIRDGAGFVANRLQFALFKEATAIVADGVATAEQVDEIVRGSFGFRLPFFGPFAIADMAGLDVYAGAYPAIEEALGPRFAVPESVRSLTGAGRLGAKTGSGYLEWPDERRERLIAGRDESYAALQRLLDELRANGKAT